MQHLDLQVIEQTLEQSRAGETVWLCTVLGTFGSSPREPGSMLAACRNGWYAGSLSGGCVEEDFLARLGDGDFDQPVQVILYGDAADGTGLQGPRVSLPCGGVLEVLVERLPADADTLSHLGAVHAALQGQQSLIRRVSLSGAGSRLLERARPGPRVSRDSENAWVDIEVGPVSRLIIAGISPVAEACADFARTLGFEVIVCDPREEVQPHFSVPGVSVKPVLPSQFIAAAGCHAATAVVALTHDPRIDDLAMIEAVRTSAFYVGVMGSHRTSRARAERLQRSGGLTPDEVARIHMPIGLALGSHTPAEIALAVMADVVRVQRDRPRDAL